MGYFAGIVSHLLVILSPTSGLSPAPAHVLSLSTQHVIHPPLSATWIFDDTWSLQQPTRRFGGAEEVGEILVRRRHPLERPGAHEGRHVWRLGLTASALRVPGDKAASVHLKRRDRLQTLRLGVESWENELLPWVGSRFVRRRMVRRVGPVLSWELTQGRRGAWRRLRPGICMHASSRLWPLGDARGATLDARGEISGLWRRRWAEAWGRATYRELLGPERPNLRLGGFMLATSHASRSRRPLSETILGYEDLQHQVRSLAQIQGGLGICPSDSLRGEFFVAAGRLGETEKAQGPLRNVQRALGVAAAKTLQLWGQPLTLVYQAAFRLDSARDKQLHMVLVSL